MQNNRKDRQNSIREYRKLMRRKVIIEKNAYDS